MADLAAALLWITASLGRTAHHAAAFQQTTHIASTIDAADIHQTASFTAVYGLINLPAVCRTAILDLSPLQLQLGR